MASHRYRSDSFRELGLGDVVMTGKERWRRNVQGLDLEPYTKALLHRGLREIHHVGDQMDGRMDACLGYSAVLVAETFETIGEVQEEVRGVQKKAAHVRADEVTANSSHVIRDKTMSQRGVTDQTFNHRRTARGISEL